MTVGRRSCPDLSLRSTLAEVVKKAILGGLMRVGRVCSQIWLRGRAIVWSRRATAVESIVIAEGNCLRLTEVFGFRGRKSPASTTLRVEDRHEIFRTSPSSASVAV